MSYRNSFFAVAFAGLCSVSQARERATIIVAANGGGNFRTIQSAVNSIPLDNRESIVILVRNGVYNEKIFIERSFVSLVGENRESTRIVYAELRENWNNAHANSDWGAGVVNIDSGATDITLANLTIYNNFGWKNGVFNKHQFAIRGAGTRIVLLHCNVISDGGDALSLWNRQSGMYYHASCFFEGWVDYVCPRGWCYITDSEFFSHSKTASIWHDGSANKDQKFVIVNSTFDGVPGFPLGRNHRDGQYVLLHCRFSERMANKPIYFPLESSNAKPWMWGARQYYSGCSRDDGNFSWFKDNLNEAEGAPTTDRITAKWTFANKWDPEGTMPSVLPFAFLPTPRSNATNVHIRSAVLSWVPGRNAESHNVYFGRTNPPEFNRNQKGASFTPERLETSATYFWRVDTVTEEGIVEGEVWNFRTVQDPVSR